MPGIAVAVLMLAAAATAMIVYVGGQFVFDNSMTIGELVLFVTLIDRFFAPIRDLSQQYSVLQSAMVAGERIFEVLDVEPEVQDKSSAYTLPPIEGKVDYVIPYDAKLAAEAANGGKAISAMAGGGKAVGKVATGQRAPLGGVLFKLRHTTEVHLPRGLTSGHNSLSNLHYGWMHPAASSTDSLEHRTKNSKKRFKT